MRVTASKLRADIYNILDETLKTGIPVEVVRKGARSEDRSETKPDKLSKRAINVPAPFHLLGGTSFGSGLGARSIW